MTNYDHNHQKVYVGADCMYIDNGEECEGTVVKLLNQNKCIFEPFEGPHETNITVDCNDLYVYPEPNEY